MSYKHGVSTLEVPTSLTAPVTASAGLPVAFGTAPVNMVENPPVNVPILAFKLQAFTKSFGISSDFENYTLSEFADCHYALFNVAPAVFVNVLDPAIHKKAGDPKTLTLKDGEALLNVTGVLPKTLVVKNSEAEELSKDAFETTFDDDGFLHIFTEVPTETIAVEYEVLAPEMVEVSDIIGGVSIDGKNKGLELVNEVFPRFRLVPGQLVAPKYSTDPGVAAVMAAKCEGINGVFKATANVDIDTTEVTDYTKVANKKQMNNLVSTYQNVCWPMVSLGGKKYHLSSQFTSLTCKVDNKNGDVPYESASNKNLQMDACVLKDGTEVFLGLSEAAYLNGNGIITAHNFTNGWTAWGNRTGAYPGNSDVKDSFTAVRRMFNWVQNSLILTYHQKVDSSTNRKLIENVVNSINIWLAGLSAREQLLGGRVEFREDENPLTALLDGKISFHVYISPPVPAREIEFLVEYDVNYLTTLFSA